MTDLDTETRRVIWRSRRGLLELDLLLPPFARACYADLAPQLKAAYRALLECEDTEISAWVQRRAVPEDPQLARIVDAILEFNQGP